MVATAATVLRDFVETSVKQVSFCSQKYFEKKKEKEKHEIQQDVCESIRFTQSLQKQKKKKLTVSDCIAFTRLFVIKISMNA